MRFFLTLALAAGLVAPAAAGDRSSEPRNCDVPTLTSPVCLAQRNWSEAEASAALGSRRVVGVSEGDELSIIARRKTAPVTLCCTIDAPLTRIGDSDLWVLSVKVLKLDRAIIDLQFSSTGDTLSAFYASPRLRPARVNRLLGSVVAETIHSSPLGEDRRLSIYLPPSHDPSVREPVVYLADGFLVELYAPAIEAAIISGRIRPVIVVGIWPGSRDPGMRAREYLIGHSDLRFREHRNFVLSEVMPLVESKYGASTQRDDRMIAGISDSAAWALATGLHEPGRFGTIASISLGWPPAADGVGSDGRPRLYLGAGVLEPDFYRVTAQTARRAQGSDSPVMFEEFASGHVAAAWQTMLIDALIWTFPRR